MSEVKISAEPRTEFGKGGARRTRRAGRVPAVLYGHGEAPRHIALPAREFAAAIRHGGINQVFSIAISDGTEALALPKAIQRDPIKDTFEHVDLLIVRRGERITVDIPIHLVGEAARNTMVMTERDRISINAEAMHLPEFVEASIDGLEAGSHLTAGDIRLPEGAELVDEADIVIAVITQEASAEQLESEGAGETTDAEPAAADESEKAGADA